MKDYLVSYVEVARDEALHEQLCGIELIAIIVLQRISDFHLVDGTGTDIDPVEVLVFTIVLVDDDAIALRTRDAVITAIPQ